MTNDTFVQTDIFIKVLAYFLTNLIGFHGNIPRWDISQLGISLDSSDLVCFSIN